MSFYQILKLRLHGYLGLYLFDFDVLSSGGQGSFYTTFIFAVACVLMWWVPML